MEKRVSELKVNCLTYVFSLLSDKLENTARIKQVKRMIAQIKTIIAEGMNR